MSSTNASDAGPLRPLRLAGELVLPGGQVGHLAVAGGVIHVVRDGDLISITGGDATAVAPRAPRVLGRLALGDGAGRIAAEGRRLAVAVDGAVALVDVADPTSPSLSSSFESGGELVSGVALRGELVLTSDGDHLTTWRSTPTGTVRLGAVAIELGGAITLAGDLALVAADSCGMVVIDLREPARPRQLGVFEGPGDVTGVAVAGDLAYVADYTGGVSIVSLAAPSKPRQLGEWDEGMVGDIAVAGSVLYVAMGSLATVDVSDPRRPRRTGVQILAPDVDTAWSVGLDGARVVALGQRGVSIWTC